MMDIEGAQRFHGHMCPGLAMERARLYESMTCAGCGEPVMETRIRLLQGQPYCIPCFETRERQL